MISQFVSGKPVSIKKLYMINELNNISDIFIEKMYQIKVTISSFLQTPYFMQFNSPPDESYQLLWLFWLKMVLSKSLLISFFAVQFTVCNCLWSKYPYIIYHTRWWAKAPFYISSGASLIKTCSTPRVMTAIVHLGSIFERKNTIFVLSSFTRLDRPKGCWNRPHGCCQWAHWRSCG